MYRKTGAAPGCSPYRANDVVYTSVDDEVTAIFHRSELTIPQYMMSTNNVEQAKRNGIVTIELAMTKGKAE